MRFGRAKSLKLGTFVNHPIIGVANRKGLPIYSTWQSMLARCYNPKHDSYDKYGGAGVTVCEEWQDFQTFARWHTENHIEGWHMDKDLLGGKLYSPETCVFLPHNIHMTITSMINPCRGYRITSSKTKPYSVVIREDGKDVRHGRYATPEEARQVYEREVYAKMNRYLTEQPLPPRIEQAILELKISPPL